MSNPEPGDLVDISQRLRKLLSAYENASAVIEGSFFPIAPELEAAAHHLRPAVETSLAHIYGFLEKLEKSPAFVQARSRKLEEYKK